MSNINMNNFQLYNELLSQLSELDDSTTTRVLNECSHENIIIEKNITLCTDCGSEIESTVGIDQEWKYLKNEVKQNTDPNRCYIRKVKDRTIYEDVNHMGFSDRIVDIANKIYIQACGEKVHRGNYRKAIIFASIFHAYKIDKNPQSYETLIGMFKLNRKIALKGLKYINQNSPKDSPIRSTYITPVNLIHEFMTEFNATSAQKEEVVALYKKVKGRSSMINRSRPQSVAAGIIYYVIHKEKKEISLKEFTKKVSLSELTVNKIAKECARILDKDNNKS
jgi:transcription initiation factor TFIIIB Brf1 subunit/transcription initiation factor TFIIB